MTLQEKIEEWRTKWKQAKEAYKYNETIQALCNKVLAMLDDIGGKEDGK